MVFDVVGCDVFRTICFVFFFEFLFFFFFKQKTAYEIGVRLVGSEMCIRDSSSNRASGNDYFFSNQLLPLVSSLSVEQRKMLIDFIELLKDYDVDKNNTKRG